MTVTLKHRATRKDGAICSKCDHDLGVAARAPGAKKKIDGYVYCSNSRCKFHREPHPTGPKLNTGKG